MQDIAGDGVLKGNQQVNKHFDNVICYIQIQDSINISVVDIKTGH